MTVEQDGNLGTSNAFPESGVGGSAWSAFHATLGFQAVRLEGAPALWKLGNAGRPRVSDGSPNDPVGLRGRLKQTEALGISATFYTGYDSMGRVTQSIQGTAGVYYTLNYTYNLAGGLETQTYPSGRQAKTCYDPSGQPDNVQGRSPWNLGLDVPYLTSLTYTPHGAPETVNLGSGAVETRGYNTGLQPSSVSLARSGASLLSLSLCYTCGGNNNGNVRQQTITIPGAGWTQNYGYDAYNRLNTATEPGWWAQTYVYDGWGNRAVLAGSWVPNTMWTPQTPSPSSVPYTGANRWTGASYDSAGNVTQVGTAAMTYDGESRQKSGGGATYFYDADGRRVQRGYLGQTTVWVYDAFGRLAAEYATAAQASLGRLCPTTDHLGSARVVTARDGEVVRRYDYLPFGEQIPEGSAGRTAAMKYTGGLFADGHKARFTGKERDAETGLDYFGARYFSGAQGRFTSVDPAMESADSSNPQSWNRYTYALNNPLRYTDPDGRVPVETFLDLASLGKSVWDFARTPSWAGAGYVAWDAASVALPYVPGSWVRRVAELGHAGLEAARGVVRFENLVEAAAAKRYLSEGVGLLGAGDDQVRSVLGLSRTDKAADFLGVTQSGKYVIGEAKGSDLASAVSQLDNTAKGLLAKQGDVRFSAEVVLKKGQALDPRFRVSGNQLQRQVWNEKKRIWDWEIQKAQGQAINVRYVD
ncbi:MAG: RHS repeat domain-containing protein [Bryobacteraceae bacterium]